MHHTFDEKLALRKAVVWWRLAYWMGYVGAAYHAVAGFVVYDARGVPHFGISSLYTFLAVLAGVFVALVSWGLHRRVSPACGLSLLLMGIATALGCTLSDEAPGRMIAAWIGTYVCLKGFLASRTLNRVCRQAYRERQRRQARGALSL